MRRIKILFFWIFINKNNVRFIELIKFLFKPTIHQTAKKHIKKIHQKDTIEFEFYTIKDRLYWPKEYDIKRMNQIISETFDINDWHYYQKTHTTIEQGEILLDIGTAEGLFPLKEIDKCEHVYLVEPGRKFYECLKKTFSQHKSKVTIINSAVGNSNGTIPFNEDSFDGAISNDSTTTNVIPINTIDNLFKNNEKISYLKADIEGFELQMLKGAAETIKRNKPKIAITTYHKENNPEEIINIIKSYVPQYKYYVKGIHEQEPKPVMIHFWLE